MIREELIKQAEELGLKVDGRWSDERLQSEIDAVLSDGQPNEGAKSYAPAIAGKVEILGVEIVNGFQLSDQLAKNEGFISRLKHAIKCGIVNELAE
jgi:hypothetical protein